MSATTAREASLLMTSKKNLIALQFAYEKKSLEENFETLSALYKKSPPSSITLAPELCLSGYGYNTLEQSALFSQKILPNLQSLSKDKTIALTLIEKKDGCFFNTLKIFFDTKLVHSRAKAKLFGLGGEDKYFSSGTSREIQSIEIDGIKIASLICFELRFTQLWQQILGADIILVPSFWGKLRKTHFSVLTRALAIANQAFVIAANSADDSMASQSAIISPFGDVHCDDSASFISREVELKEIQKMRKYINIGI